MSSMQKKKKTDVFGRSPLSNDKLSITKYFSTWENECRNTRWRIIHVPTSVLYLLLLQPINFYFILCNLHLDPKWLYSHISLCAIAFDCMGFDCAMSINICPLKNGKGKVICIIAYFLRTKNYYFLFWLSHRQSSIDIRIICLSPSIRWTEKRQEQNQKESENDNDSHKVHNHMLKNRLGCVRLLFFSIL